MKTTVSDVPGAESRGRLSGLWAPLFWTAYVLAPATGWGLLDGRPLRPLEMSVLFVFWWLWAARRLPLWRWLPIALFAAKALVGYAILVPHGFAARYYANPDWSSAPERSVDFPRASFTRIDERLAFGTRRSPDLPLYFFNDLRFNFYQPGSAAREKLGYSVVWIGYLRVEGQSPIRLFVAGDGVTSDLSIDDRGVLQLERGEPSHDGTVAVGSGWHRVTIRLSAPYGSGRRFEAGLIDSSGRRTPFDGAAFFPQAFSWGRLLADRAARMVSFTIDLLLLIALAGWSWRAGREDWRAVRTHLTRVDTSLGLRLARAWPSLLSLAWVAAFGDALLFALPYVNRVLVLGGGDDPLAYEYFSRDILLNGPLMTLGAPLGQGAPFYYHLFYPYFLALGHLIGGEDYFTIFFLQRLLMAATALSLGRLTRLVFGKSAGWLGLLLGFWFVYFKVAHWAGVQLGEALFIPLIAVWTERLVTDLVMGPRVWRAMLIGVVGGVAVMTRPSLMLGLALGIPLWTLALSVRPRRRRSTSRAPRWAAALGWGAFITVVTLGTISLATARNWVVAHQFVPMTTTFSASLFLGNPPPPSVMPPPAARASVYKQLGVDDKTAAVVEFAVQAPVAFLQHLGKKLLYTLGFFSLSGLFGLQGIGVAYVVVWLLGGLGVVIALTHWRGAAFPYIVRLLPAAICLTHVAAMMAIFPNVYGDRLMIPLYVLLIPYAALVMRRVVQRDGAVLFGIRLPYPAMTAGMAALLVALMVSGDRGHRVSDMTAGVALLVIIGTMITNPGTRAGSVASGFSRTISPVTAVPLVAFWVFLTVAVAFSGTQESVLEYRWLLLFVVTTMGISVAARGATRNALVATLVVFGAIGTIGYAWAGGGEGPAQRMVAWDTAGRMIADRPWVGVGPGMFRTVSPDYQGGAESSKAFNAFLQMAAESGVIAAGCYLGIWLQALFLSLGIAKRPADAPIAVGLHAILLALFMIGLGHSVFSFETGGHLFLMIAAGTIGLTHALRARSSAS